MGLWGHRESVAIGFGPDAVRLLVGRANGQSEALFSGREALPEAAVRGALQAPAFGDREAVLQALGRLIQAARSQGFVARRPALVSVVVSDGTVKMTAAPFQGAIPPRAEGNEMARWALHELLPVAAAETRVDWAVIPGGESADDNERSSWFLALGADEQVVREYEELVSELGWTVGRFVPWTMAAAAAAGEGTSLILCAGDGTLAGLFEAAGVPRLHRAWRARVPVQQIRHELPALQRFVADRLETTVTRVRVCGDQEWMRDAAQAARDSGLQADQLTPEQALMGALRE